MKDGTLVKATGDTCVETEVAKMFYETMLMDTCVTCGTVREHGSATWQQGFYITIQGAIHGVDNPAVLVSELHEEGREQHRGVHRKALAQPSTQQPCMKPPGRQISEVRRRHALRKGHWGCRNSAYGIMQPKKGKNWRESNKRES